MNLAIALQLALAAAIGADPSPAALSKARADLSSSRVEVRRKAMQDLIHSELSPHLFKEMQAGLKDADGEVRATAATAIGNLVRRLRRPFPRSSLSWARTRSRRRGRRPAPAPGRIGKAVPTNRDAVKPLRRAAAEDADPVTRTVALERWP